MTHVYRFVIKKYGLEPYHQFMGNGDIIHDKNEYIEDREKWMNLWHKYMSEDTEHLYGLEIIDTGLND